MEYFTLLTDIGAQKIASSIANNTDIEITHIALGDGNGTIQTPNAEQTALVNEVHKRQINELNIDENIDNHIIARAILPSDVGNFWIREVGIYDKDNDLIAVGNYPETYKSILSNGISKEVDLKVIFKVTNANEINLVIDPTIVMASQEFVLKQILDESKKTHTHRAPEIITDVEHRFVPDTSINQWNLLIEDVDKLKKTNRYYIDLRYKGNLSSSNALALGKAMLPSGAKGYIDVYYKSYDSWSTGNGTASGYRNHSTGGIL